MVSRGQGNKADPDSCEVERGDAVSVEGEEYRVLSDDEADEACMEHIADSLWSFNADFLSGETDTNSDAFKALSKQCENGNDAIRSIIDGTCGIDAFVDSAVSADGRGHFLSPYDGAEQEQGDYYLYRTN